ncbi:MAG TPA: hypothetical protein VFI30_01610 [Nocardioidaceae bacterium]|nr:hypothetical protein [Nocardioidaceae bacterium]
MAGRVFLHVGGLKTGTTYLQRLMWANRERLSAVGTLFPGEDDRDHVWASITVRHGTPPSERAARAWEIILAQVRDFPGDAVISHEFLGLATRAQAEAALACLAPAEVHVVYTARDLIRVVPALWQEQVKYRHTGRLSDFRLHPDAPANPNELFGWRGVDVVGALRRWGATLPPSRVHVVTVPRPGAPSELLWQRFASACGIDVATVAPDQVRANNSMGAVEVELLRRVNSRLADEIRGPGEVPMWTRNYLADHVLAIGGGARFGLDDQRRKEMYEWGAESVARLREAGYQVVGDLDELLGDPDAAYPADPDRVGDDALLDAALNAMSTMLSDYRQVWRDRRSLRRQLRRAREMLQGARRPSDAREHGAARLGVSPQSASRGRWWRRPRRHGPTVQG